MTNCQVNERLLLSLRVLALHFNYPASLHSSDSRHRPALTPWPVIKVTFIHHSDEFWPCSSRNSLLSCFVIAGLLSVCGWENTGCCRPGSRGQTGSMGESVQREPLRAAYVPLTEHLTVLYVCNCLSGFGIFKRLIHFSQNKNWTRAAYYYYCCCARQTSAPVGFESFIVILDIF